MSAKINLVALQRPMLDEEVNWRVDSIMQQGKRVRLLAYIDARAAMERLDEAAGPAGWTDSYMPGPAGGVMCSIAIKFDGEWVTKTDVAENTNIEAIKGGVSDAFKRACVKWGIGRNLYDLGNTTVDVVQHYPKGVEKKFVVRIYSKRDNVKGWAVAPSIRKMQEPPAPPKTDAELEQERREFAEKQEPPAPPAHKVVSLPHDEMRPCPACGTGMFDERETKTKEAQPDWRCGRKSCGKVIWANNDPNPPKEGTPWTDAERGFYYAELTRLSIHKDLVKEYICILNIDMDPGDHRPMPKDMANTQRINMLKHLGTPEGQKAIADIMADLEAQAAGPHDRHDQEVF